MAPPPYRLLRRRSLSPLVITCEHASRRLPAGIPRTGLAELLACHRGWDIGVWEVAREVSRRLAATAIGGRYSRLFVDLNRDPSDPTLMLTEVDGRPVPINRRLTPREAGRRVRLAHAPYHAEIDRQMARRSAARVSPLLISFHSFTPVLNPARRRFDVGVLFADHAPLARRLGAALVRQGFSLRFNRPYSGLEGLIYAAARHGSFHRVPYLELEFNQKLLGTPPRCRIVGARAAGAIAEILAEVRAEAIRIGRTTARGDRIRPRAEEILVALPWAGTRGRASGSLRGPPPRTPSRTGSAGR